MIHLSAKPRSRHHIIKSLLTVSFITIVAAVGFLMLTKPAHVAAADANGCTVPSGGGTDSFDATNTPTTSTSQGLDITSPGTYYLWMRMESPDGTHNTLSVSVNGGYCFAIGGTMAANTWTWENNVYGGQAAVFTLPAGDNTLVITGANGVSLDSWLLTQQSPSQCTPTGITSATDCEPALPVAIPYYLAAGATKDQTVNAGQSWNADTLSPTSSYVSGGTTDCQGGTISGPGDNQPIFDCERWDSGGGITYTIPVANGTYDLRLLFAEIYSGCDKVGCRVENVSVNSKTVISNLDVYKQVGANAAYYVDVPVTVSNNQIVVTFTTVTGNAKVSGLEILKNTPPSVAFTAPISGATVSGASVPVSAAASSSVGIQSVEFVNNFTPIATDTTAPYSATFDSTSVANGNYLLSVIATDINGNTFQTTEPITVDNQVCSTAPSAPTNVKDPDTTLSANKVDLSWTAVTAPTNCLLSGYNIYRGTSATNLTKIAGPVTTASYDDSTVAAGTTYYYQVTAVDNDTSASESAKSPTTPLSSTTAANCTSGNSSVPSTPVLTATGGISYTSIPLSWTASTVNNGCTLSGYHVYRTGDTTPIYSGPATSFTDTGTGLTPANLVSGTSYSYTIVAYDSGGNDSVAGSASATTEEDNQAPVLPANPTPSNITS
jgi:fibronectin type 3 domain-containing protein